MFGIIIMIIVGLTWFAAGVKVAVVLAAILGFGWTVHAMRVFSVNRTVAEESKAERSRLLGRRGTPGGRTTFPGRQPSHAPIRDEDGGWCDGWCDDPKGHRVSTVVSRRKKNSGIAEIIPSREAVRKKK